MASSDASTRVVVRVRLVIDGSRRRARVLFAEAGEDALVALSSLLAERVGAAVEGFLQEDPASAAAGCITNLLAAVETLLPRGAAAASESSSVAPPPPGAASRATAGRAAAGEGVMARRLFRCDHLRCRCSDAVSQAAGSACPCGPCAGPGGGTRDKELHFLESCFFRRPDGSAATVSRGGGRCGDTFFRCRARDESRGRDFSQCRYRVTDERGVECPLCHTRTTVEVKCAKGGREGSSVSAPPPDEAVEVKCATGDREGSSVSAPPPDDAGRGSSTTSTYAIMDDLSVRPVPAGLSAAALLSALGVAADPATVREETVQIGYKEGLTMLWASLRSKTVLTDVFLPAAAGAKRRRC
ncbi:hypothetical protein BS78_03G062100 [Paspalum vaginatum]|nr:hypothetical protein BS78_03G062100 [Paspalum vaginatum]